MLCVALFQVTDSDDELFEGHVGLVGILVALAGESCIIDQVVRISSETRNHAINMLVQTIDFLACFAFFFQFFLLKCNKYILCSRRLEISSLTVARTMPSLVRIPMEEPVLLMASIAYSTCIRRPSGEKVVVFESYLRD